MLYAITLAVLAGGFHWIGEQNLTFGVLLYVPRQIFLVPLPPLLFLTLIFHWRLVFIQIASAAAFLVLGMGWEARRSADWGTGADAGTLTVLTYNRGQHGNQSLQPFKNYTRPDLIVFQEAPLRAQRYAKAEGYEEFIDNLSEGEFTLLSRFPIVSSRLVTVKSLDQDRAVAARFEVDLGDRKVAVYSVHFRSPRDILRYHMRGAFLYGIIGWPGTPFAEKRKINQAWWDDRISQAKQLLDVIQTDSLPVIVAGDFNAPSGGYIYRLVKDRLRDAHLESGSGFGFTFPGSTRNPLSLGGPWMRIDYIFCSSHWRPAASLVEPNRRSQHRALAARLRFETTPIPETLTTK